MSDSEKSHNSEHGSSTSSEPESSAASLAPLKGSQETVESAAQEALLQAKAAIETLEKKDALDFSILAPKKATWDLQQYLEPKLQKLEKQTQKAIVELIRQRLLDAHTSQTFTST